MRGAAHERDAAQDREACGRGEERIERGPVERAVEREVEVEGHVREARRGEARDERDEVAVVELLRVCPAAVRESERAQGRVEGEVEDREGVDWILC